MENYSQAYKKLNKIQKTAVDTLDGPLLVLAGPGTGKTQLLSVRAASILKNRGAAPENILVLTYTNSASKEMKERNAAIIGHAGYDIEVGTFHSFANSIIQESEEAKDYVGNRIQMNEVEQVMAIQYILDHTDGVEDIRPFRSPYTYLDEILRRIGELKRDGITPHRLNEYLESAKIREACLEEKYSRRLTALAIVYGRYEELKEGRNKDVFDDRGRYDFDDMILFATAALKNEPGLREAYKKRFRYVMVDEYQDTNGSQLELLLTMLDYEAPNLACVGDDDQSIYRFQGASVGNFKTLKERFPELKTISLEDNYRSSGELIDMAANIIGTIPLFERAGEKPLKAVKKYRDKEILYREFSTEDEEMLFIIQKIEDLKTKISSSPGLTEAERSRAYNNIAVFVRKRMDILKIVDALLQAGIPYATDGKEDISGEKRPRQLLDVLDLAFTDPADYARKDLVLYKVLTSDYFEIPLSEILKFIGRVNTKREKEKMPALTLTEEFLTSFPSSPSKGTAGPKGLYRAAYAIHSLLENANTKSIHGLLLDFVKDAGIYKHILKEYQGMNVLRIRELRSLVSFVNMVKAADLARPALRLDEFMAELKTRKDHGLPIRGNLVTMTQDGVRILTAHASKGQEFHSVFIPFCLQNKNWPARRIPEKIQLPPNLFKERSATGDKESLKQLFLKDETRLFYVAITRARSDLIFTSSPDENSIASSYLDRLGLEAKNDAASKEEDLFKAALKKTELNDPFIGTKSVLKDLVKNMTLNPTRVNNYISCRRKFFYNDVLKLPGAKKKSLVFGNCVHKALEDTYREYQTTNIFPAFNFFRESFERELRFQGVDKSISAQCLGMEQMNKLEKWFNAMAKNPVMPIGLEKKLLVTIGDNIIFTGKYDKLEWEDKDKGLVRIIDYKTGKPDKHIKNLSETISLASDECDGYLRQLVAYRLLFEKDKSESKRRRVRCGTLVFTEPVFADMKKLGYKEGDYVSKSIEITEAMVREMEALIKNVWNDISRLRFEKLQTRDDDKCGTCDFDVICWG